MRARWLGAGIDRAAASSRHWRWRAWRWRAEWQRQLQRARFGAVRRDRRRAGLRGRRLECSHTADLRGGGLQGATPLGVAWRGVARSGGGSLGPGSIRRVGARSRLAAASGAVGRNPTSSGSKGRELESISRRGGPGAASALLFPRARSSRPRHPSASQGPTFTSYLPPSFAFTSLHLHPSSTSPAFVGLGRGARNRGCGGRFGAGRCDARDASRVQRPARDSSAGRLRS